MESTPIDDRNGVGLFFSSKENRSAEEPLETFEQAAVMRAVFGKMEKFQHFGCSIEMNFAGFLAECERGDPDGNQPILAEGQPVVRMGDDVKEKFAIAATMDDLAGWRPAQGEPTQNEWTGVESELLMSLRALFADQADGFDLLESPFGNAENWKDLAYVAERGRANRWR